MSLYTRLWLIWYDLKAKIPRRRWCIQCHTRYWCTWERGLCFDCQSQEDYENEIAALDAQERYYDYLKSHE